MVGFRPVIAEKVERLLDLLEELERHPKLHGKVCMHGGTAINLFMLEVPRLSVDIDLSYIGAEAKESMLAERPLIEGAIMEVGRAQGYLVSPTVGDHAGRTFKLAYRSKWGVDSLKIDMIYLNRVPILPVQTRSCLVRDDTIVAMFDDFELIGGKVKALYDRVKVRDLYDIASIYSFLNESNTGSSAHKTMLFYASISACFPNSMKKRAKTRFSDRQRDLEKQLYPMLRTAEAVPALKHLISQADQFIEEFVLPQDTLEQEYLELFAAGVFEPELLFGAGEAAENARRNPSAAWKLFNINKMLKG